MWPGSPIFFFVEEAGRDRILGKGLQRERRDELGRILRHDDKDSMTLLNEQAGELGGFVCGDRAGDAENNGFCGSHKATTFPARFSRSAF